jgi:RNA polymerase sigma factor (sigma-70 family)
MSLEPADLDALVTRAIAGDEPAFTALVEHTLDELRCFVALRASDADMADEAVQATYIDAFRQLARYRPGHSLLAWLKGIARHRVQRAQRERARRPVGSGTSWLMEVEAPLPADDDSAAHDQGTAILARLKECLSLLTPGTATLVERHYRDGLSLADLATALGRSPGGLAVTLCRARTALRSCLERNGIRL